MKGHLDARNTVQTEKFIHRCTIGFFVAVTMRCEEHDTVTSPAILIAITPVTARIKLDNRIDPTRTVEVGPLIGEAQMRLDNLTANRLEVDAPGVTSEMATQPIAAITFGFRF